MLKQKKLSVTCAMFALLFPGQSTSEQVRYVFDELCVSEKVIACTNRATQLYSKIGVRFGGANSPLQNLCLDQTSFGPDLNFVGSVESSIRYKITEKFGEDIVFSKAQGFQLDSQYCPFKTKQVSKWGDREFNFGCGPTNGGSYVACQLTTGSAAISHQYFSDIAEICEAAVRQIPYRDGDDNPSCVRELTIPEADLEQSFIDAINVFGEVVVGLGDQIAGKDAPNQLTCPSGKRVDLVYAEERQQSGLESFRKWFTMQDHTTNPVVFYQSETLVYKKNAGDGDFVTVQAYSDDDRALALDWHRFIQSSLATEVRFFVVTEPDLTNLDRPKQQGDIEIIFPRNVDVASRPYLASCVGDGGKQPETDQ